MLEKLEDHICFPLKKINDVENHFWVYGIVLKHENKRDSLQKKLFQDGIETRPFFWPLHLQNALPSEFKTETSLPVSENLGRNGLYLPLGKHINDKIQAKVVESVSNFFG